MSQTQNSWGVEFSLISWVQNVLNSHKNISKVERHDDIIFELDRKGQGDHLRLLCCNEYTCGVTVVQRGLAEFGELDIIYVGGTWNAYTREAKEYCIDQEIGLFNSSELNGALWQKDYWAYHRRDDDGNPVFYFRSE